MKASTQAGFSLLGVLITVMIIGLMAAIAVPKFSSAMISANTSRIAADLATIDLAIALYEVDNGKSPTALTDLSDYIKDVDKVTPPKGKYRLHDGTIEEVAASDVYTLSTPIGTGLEREALLKGHNAKDFSR